MIVGKTSGFMQVHVYVREMHKMRERLKGKVGMVMEAGSVGPGWGNGKETAGLLPLHVPPLGLA